MKSVLRQQSHYRCLLRLHQPGLVGDRPVVDEVPKVRDDGLVDVSPVWVDLAESACGQDVASGRTLSSVTFQSFILGFGGSLDHVTYMPLTRFVVQFEDSK